MQNKNNFIHYFLVVAKQKQFHSLLLGCCKTKTISLITSWLLQNKNNFIHYFLAVANGRGNNILFSNVIKEIFKEKRFHIKKCCQQYVTPNATFWREIPHIRSQCHLVHQLIPAYCSCTDEYLWFNKTESVTFVGYVGAVGWRGPNILRKSEWSKLICSAVTTFKLFSNSLLSRENNFI